jgi:hypothetical protein
MIPHGIPVAQIDSNLEADAKVRLLARRLDPMTYYAALGAYTSIVLAAWANARREPDPEVVELVPPNLLDALRSVGLLDGEGAIPERAFEKWPGSVLESRQARAEQLRSIASEGGRARARGPRDDAGRLLSPAVTAGDPAVTAGDPAVPTLLSSSSTPTTTPRGNNGEVQEGFDDPVVTYYTLTTRYPKGNALAWCKRLGDDYGFASASGSMGRAWAADDNVGTLLSRTEDILVAAGRTAELAEKADERERLRQKRATRLAPVDVPTPERAGAILADIRKSLGR